jgi:peptidoglycan/xylan/chitin deacetylase (PgdA/CDA1 family)
MCHGISPKGDYPLTEDHFDALVRIAREMGFESINYDDLDAWRNRAGELPEHSIMFDFDHPVKSMRYGIHTVLSRYGYSGNLFINTGPMDSEGYGTETMTWDEAGELIALGWHIGAHTVTHPNLSDLLAEDPTGEKLSQELETCDATLKKHLGIQPQDFAFTGTSWSSMAEKLVMQRYRFGRLWIVGTEYQADGKTVRYADLVDVDGDDEADGGPPMAARYITRQTPAFRLPSMEIQRPLIYAPEAFRAYLEGAIADVN